jgi:hypothetical protein
MCAKASESALAEAFGHETPNFISLGVLSDIAAVQLLGLPQKVQDFPN